MSAASLVPLRPKYFSAPTDALIAARELIAEVLDERARQANLFEAPKPPAPVPAVPAAVPDVLSPSSANCYLDCSARWYYRKVLQLPEVRTAALGLGSAVHAALACNFREKRETGDDLPFEALRPVFLDAFAKEFDTVTLSADDDPHDLLACGETMLRVYLEQAAPAIEPAAVELPVEGEIGGVKVRGIVDLLDVDGRIIDFKTASKKPAGFPAAHRLQVTTYTMITPGASGRARLDTLTKTKTVALHPQSIDVTPADRRHAERLYSITLDSMRSGLVCPNRGSFLCSKRNCSFWETCLSDYGGVVNE